MIPSFAIRSNHLSCEFAFQIPEGYVVDKSDFTIGEIVPGQYKDKCNIVVQIYSGWAIEEAYLNVDLDDREIFFECVEGTHAERMAYPIDPAMTEKDINGASIIYPNETNTGWLFAHALPAHHDDRIITLEAVMHTLFENLVYDKLDDVLKAVIGHNNPSPKIGTELLYTYQAQSGAYANYGTIRAFQKECVKWCSEVEKLLHVGQHVQEDDHTLKHQLVRAINQAKAVWKADTEGKALSLVAIEGHVNAIIAHVERDHAFETRWVKAAKAKAAADAANSETETTPSE